MTQFILEDPYILNIYDAIINYEKENNAPAFHGKTHAVNVMRIIEELLKMINCDKKIIHDAKIAALLHDLGCTKGKDDHELRSYDIAKEYLKKNKIEINNIQELLESIKNHRNGWDSKNIITLALILADKLDITQKRLAPYGYNLVGNRQLQYIKDIKFKILNNTFIVDICVEQELDIEELLNFKFMKKVFKSIETYAQFNNLKSLICINQKEIKRR